MGNGEWGMGNGEWGMGNGEWGMGNGEWGMGNEKLWSAVIPKKLCWSLRSTAKRRELHHSRSQSPRSFWSAPGIETSGRDRSRKSANHGLPAFMRSLRNLKQ